MKYQDNKVTFTAISASISEATFTVTDFSITEGHDPDGKIFDGLLVITDSQQNLNFEIGKKGSPEVANWFVRNTQPNLKLCFGRYIEINFHSSSTANIYLFKYFHGAGSCGCY